MKRQVDLGVIERKTVFIGHLRPVVGPKYGVINRTWIHRIGSIVLLDTKTCDEHIVATRVFELGHDIDLECPVKRLQRSWVDALVIFEKAIEIQSEFLEDRFVGARKTLGAIAVSREANYTTAPAVSVGRTAIDTVGDAAEMSGAEAAFDLVVLFRRNRNAHIHKRVLFLPTKSLLIRARANDIRRGPFGSPCCTLCGFQGTTVPLVQTLSP
jgi:hypothetical protein